MADMHGPTALPRFGAAPPSSVLYEVNSAAHAEDYRLGISDPLIPFMYEFLNFVDDDAQRVREKKHWP